MALEPQMRQPPIQLPPDVELPAGVTLRRPRVADHPAVVGAIPDWWGMPSTSIHLDEARAAGCHRVDAITGVPNRNSQAFHAALGFEASGDTDFDGVRAWRDYDGPGEHRVAFSRAL